jgi:protein-disulfide isomerase
MKDTLDQEKDNEAMPQPGAAPGENYEDDDQRPQEETSGVMNFLGKKIGFGYIALALLIIVVLFFGAKNKILEYFSEPYNPEVPAISKPEDAEAMQPAEPASPADEQKDAASDVPQDSAAMPQPQGSGMTEDGVKVIVKDFILNNPEVIMESLSKLQKKAEEQQAQESKESKEFLNKSGGTMAQGRPFIGNKDGTMNIVEFFDYQCIHCKNVYPDLMKLIAAYPNLKISLVQLPFMGPTSAKAVKFSLAVNNLYPDKFYSFHSDLIQSHSISEEGIMSLIDKYGLDKASLTIEANSDKVDKMIKDNLDLAQKSGVRGVPSFVINGESIPGAPSYDELKAKIDTMMTSK